MSSFHQLVLCTMKMIDWNHSYRNVSSQPRGVHLLSFRDTRHLKKKMNVVNILKSVYDLTGHTKFKKSSYSCFEDDYRNSYQSFAPAVLKGHQEDLETSTILLLKLFNEKDWKLKLLNLPQEF